MATISHSSSSTLHKNCRIQYSGVVPAQNQYSVAKFFKLMSYERLRLITYLLYGHQWPKMDVISPSDLAKAGFFYLRDDAVQCTFCRGIIKDWNPGKSCLLFFFVYYYFSFCYFF